MNHGKYIGRVGGLAVALGVGMAVASGTGIAYAETSDSSSAGEASTASEPAAKSPKAPRHASSDAGAGTDRSRRHGAAESSAGADSGDVDRPGGLDDDGDEPLGLDEQDGPEVDDLDTDDEVGQDEPADIEPEADEGSAGAELTVSDGDTAGEGPADPPEPAALTEPVADADAPAAPAPPAQPASGLTTTTVAASAPTAPESASDPAAPATLPVAMAVLAAARDELERNLTASAAAAAIPPEIELLADDSPNVLVIGVDGTNLSRVLDDVSNTNFFSLMQGGTTAPASIVGHTTISNPSWTSILTGAWGEKTGVINNVFTPWTYAAWPTVYTQLETFNPLIQTTSIANWDVISGIAGAGAIGADDIVDIAHIPGDTNWLLTDDAVGDATELAVAAADPSVPNFIFSYFVGVDENGHMYGGASPQYAAAIRNVDRNLGEILQEVQDWETLTGEQWTILVVTDHGHQPQQGFGHGFQSPDETATFVIAENPDIFAAGAINLRYQIVDVTPTVMTLFGGTPAEDSDGVSLTTLDASNVFPINDDAALRGALQDAIDMYGYPDILTDVALGIRTVAATVPYLVYGFRQDITAQLQQIADQGIFLISPLAGLAIVPVRLVADLTYVVTNVVAQVVARLTGVQGASIFPLWPPAPPSVDSPEPGTVLEALACAGAEDPAGEQTCDAVAV
ncbi:MAG: alkaline phosphatase family protein [Actinomycetota bacterium]|nr:alkaline phosphatase family protein [Actinomycetota bacterium]